MAKGRDGNTTTEGTEERGRDATTGQGGRQREKSVSRDVLGRAVEELGGRLEKVEHTATELERYALEEFERVKLNTIETDTRFAQLEKTVMGAIQGLRECIEDMQTRIAVMEQDLVLCKRAAANGGVANTGASSARVDYPRPSRFNSVRDAKEVENFLWEMDRYFENLGLTDEPAMIKTATSYLADTAMLWWRRRYVEIERGDARIETWDEFKKDLKRQFYPENVVYQARKKLRELCQRGTIRDYVNDFTSLMLRIPSMTDENSVFYFIHGLQNWAKQELQRRGIHSLDEAILAAESLSDFSTHDRKKSYERQEGYPANGGGDRSSRPATPRKDENGPNQESGKPYSKGFGKGSNREEYEARKKSFNPKGGCYVCKGPHAMKDCPKLGSLSAIMGKGESGGESEEETTIMGSLQLLNALTTKPEPRRELMYVETQLNGKLTKAMVDTGATHNFIAEEEERKLGLTWVKGERWVKSVNGKAQPLLGFARCVDLRMGTLKGRANFSVIPMDDYGVVIGLDFMRSVGAVPMPSLNSIAILEKDTACMIPTVSVKGKRPVGIQGVSALRIMEDPTERNKDKFSSIRSRRIKIKTWENHGADKTTTRTSPNWVGENVTHKNFLQRDTDGSGGWSLDT
ncbi:Retrotransposon gag domain [Arabidopsis suecica]|uniref:Retrotransposon gag domain n=1 Tax=Arabidopsis suecica TaxID=45249 RepID=A0A8T1YNT8_ARASU|nr:Retrotransposon gag domain [Arabidopsis suecica]